MKLRRTGLYEVTLEPLGRDRLKRRGRVEAETPEEAAAVAAERYAADRRIRTTTNAVRAEWRADAFDRMVGLPTPTYPEFKQQVAAVRESVARRLADLADVVEVVSVETIREPEYADDETVAAEAEEARLRTERARARAVEARARRAKR
jgi:hypothetical protein